MGAVTDSLTQTQDLRRRVSRLLPGYVVSSLEEPSNNRASGLSGFTKFVSKPPRNAAEAETYHELFELGYLPVASGWPDFFVIEDADDIFVVEVKGPGDSLRPNQIVVLEMLASAGIDTYIRRPHGYEAVGDSKPWGER